jgi:SPP1 gp7 family putative phage head morphogenesis protein
VTPEERKLIELHEREARRMSSAIVRAALATGGAWVDDFELDDLNVTAPPKDRVISGRADLLAAAIRAAAARAAAAAAPSTALVATVAGIGLAVQSKAVVAALRGLVQAGANKQALRELFRVVVDQPGTIPGTRALIGIDVAPTAAMQALIESWAGTNVDLIRTYPVQALAGIDRLVAERVRAGVRWGTIAGELQERLGMSERHAVLVARDQTGKLLDNVTHEMHQRAGVRQYRWRTAKDSRVRDEHRRLEGQVFDEAGPGAPGAGPYGEPAHPGQGIQCRCYREPIVEGVPGLSRPPREGFPAGIGRSTRPTKTTGTIPRRIR